MGIFSRKVFPACGSMCVCCPALRSRSRQPVKRYKKLLAEIFPKSAEAQPNERKITKLCEYAAKNPFRIPKIAKYLEDKCYRELRSGHIKLVHIVAESYKKLLCMCKEQIAYFSINLMNVFVELLDDSKQDAVNIIGCQTLTAFIYCQVDGTYVYNIENFVHKVCMLARKTGEDQQTRCLRASSLQCLSAMIWFMSEFSHIFVDFDEIVSATLDNYETGSRVEDDERAEGHHNWVDEVVRCEGRGTSCTGGGYSPSYRVSRPRPEKKEPFLLTSEEVEMPQVWAQICIQRMVELAKESITMRRVLDPIFVYFDTGNHWVPGHGLAAVVLSNMAYFIEDSGNQVLLLAGVVRHLDHKNVVHDPKVKFYVIQTATNLAYQIRPGTVISDIGFVSDLCRHLRKSLQAMVESVGEQELNLNLSLQTSIEDCLLEISRGIVDLRPLFDMMALTLEKLPSVRAVAQATIGSLIILAHVISTASISLYSQQVFPEALLVQLLKLMLHRDAEIRVGGHHILSVLLAPSYSHTRHDVSNHSRKWHSKNATTFASIKSLLERLRGEANGTKLKNGTPTDESKERENVEEWKLGLAHNSPNSQLISSIIDRTIPSSSLSDTESSFLRCNEDQIMQLLSTLWIEANLPDNQPSNVEAIAHTFCLVLISSQIKKSNCSLVVRFFQFPLSLRNMSLDSSKGSLPPSYRRSLFVLSTAMLMFTAKLYRIPVLNNLLDLLAVGDVDPYVGINDDFQVYSKPQVDITQYGSVADNSEALSILHELENKAYESYKLELSLLVESLSNITELEADYLATELSKGFVPDDTLMFGQQSMLDMDHVQRIAHSKQSLSFDGDFSALSLGEDDASSVFSVADISNFVPKVPSSPSPPMSQIVSIGQLLESALEVAGQVAGTSISTSPLPYSTMASQCESLGTDTRKKLPSWFTDTNHCTKGDDKLLSTLPIDGMSSIRKIIGNEEPMGPMNPWLALRLPPASPFDNFLKAARG